MPSKGNKKDLLSPLHERTLDIVYKCLESRVAGVDDISTETLCLLHAILNNVGCDWARHVYDCLEFYVLKAGVEESDSELKGNVGYSFMIYYLLKLKGIFLKPGLEVHPHTYLFKTSIKKTQEECY